MLKNSAAYFFFNFFPSAGENYFLRFLLLIFPIFILGCSEKDNPVVQEIENDRFPFEIRLTDYSENHFFLDAVYIDTILNIFNEYHGNAVPIVYPEYTVSYLEVYVSTNSFNPETDIEGTAYLFLPQRETSDLYSDIYRNSGSSDVLVGPRETGYFRKLSEGADYEIHPFTGFITLFKSMEENQALAVAYKTYGEEESKVYGEFISEIVNNSVNDIVLKLIKPKNLSPEMKDAWKLKLKNIYKIPTIEEIDDVEDLELDIFLQNADGSFANEMNNMKLLELFGMDRIDKKGTGNPDGKFDLVPGITINMKTSEIIFPTLEPFGRNLPQELNDSLKIPELYNSTKNSVRSRMNFIIKGSYKYE